VTGAPGGITFLDHTADVGMEVTAPSLEALFHRAALGMLALLRGHDDAPERDAGRGPGVTAPAPDDTRTLALDAEDGAALLAAWLKELLFFHETRHADYADATFRRLTAERLEARVRTAPAAHAVREIKGVTYHELAVEETADGWKARVIFDV
jgi:SHS2 domain-containing protein